MAAAGEDPTDGSAQEAPQQSTEKREKTSIIAVLEERRQFEGGNDGEGDQERDPGELTKPELIKRAKVHMMQTACTKWDDKAHRYKFQPVFGTSRRQLGVLGFGVSLYFQFLCQMSCVFFLLTLMSLPLLLTNLSGDLVTTDSYTQQAFGMLSIANLGACGPYGIDCANVEQLQNRKAGFTFSFAGLTPETTIKTLTPIFGTLDGVGLLVFMSFGLFFTRIWIKREQPRFDQAHVTASDFTVRVRNLPAKLSADDHPNYEKLLKEHFTNVLKERCGVNDDDPVHEVVLVRNHRGAVGDFITQGQYLLEKKDLQVRKQKAATEKKQERLQTGIDKLNNRIMKMEKSFANGGKDETEKDVAGQAFVTLKRAGYMDKLLYEYRFARSRVFRCCLDKPLRFRGHSISVYQARDPSDLFWENMDFGTWQRRARFCTTCLLTLIILAFCLVALIYCRMIGIASQATPPQTDLWVVKSMQNTSCFTLCEWSLYSDGFCRTDAGLGSTVGLWDSTGLTVNHSAQTACSSNYWSSNICSGGTVQAQWIGVQFSANVNPGCMQFKQLASSALNKVELYACSSSAVANLSTVELQRWSPEEHCIGMQDLTASTIAQGNFSASGRQLVVSDSSCRRTVSYEGATQALQAKVRELKAATPSITDADANYMASTTDPTMNCYCKQQETVEGITSFRAPPYDRTPAKILCKDWIYYQNMQLTQMVVGVLAVCILNLVLVFIFDYLAVWERHSNFTEQNSSQFMKLFVAQFMNMALIVLLVNANWRNMLKNVWIVDFLGLGNGTYDDFDSGWFVAVGSGLCLTIALQIITATTPGIIMSYVVNPLMICFFRMGLVTQKLVNQVYVFPQWNLANRLAQTMTVIFVVLMYSGGMPILNVIGFLYCVMAYWMDKWCLLRGSSKPPSYDSTLLVIAANMIPVAAFLHAVVTLWCFGNQNTFPADWSILQSFFGGLIDMDEARYTSLVEQYYVSTEEQRNNIFVDYVHARTLDFARWSCWLLLCIFLVFCVYYVLHFVFGLLLKPVMAPFYIYISGKCSRGVTVKDEETDSYEEKYRDMLDNGLIPSYSMHANPRYAAVLDHLQDGGKEVAAAKLEYEASQSAKAAAKQAAAQKKDGALRETATGQADGPGESAV